MSWFNNLFIKEAKAALESQGSGGASAYFGEITTMGDTLTWDGNTQGLPNYEGGLYCVSDHTPTLDEVQNGFILQFSDGSVYTAQYDSLKELYDEYGCITDQGVFIIYADKLDIDGMLFPQAGIYFYDEGTIHTVSLTIPGYGKFETTEVKRLDAKYLPNVEDIPAEWIEALKSAMGV